MQPSREELQEDSDPSWPCGCCWVWWPVRHRRLRLDLAVLCAAAALFERSRHACYVLLRGPQAGEGPGPVSLMKRKLKEDVLVSRVIWLRHTAGDDEQLVRDRLYRMRFQSRD